MAQAMGLASPADVSHAIAETVYRLGLPSGLGAVGVTAEMFPAIISLALADHCHQTNPRRATAEDYAAILEASM
jgi:alcohol dehydrogenase class IV